MVDPWTNYVNMVSGLSKATRARARTAAQALLVQAGLDEVAADANERISKLTDEIVAVSRANRELLENLVTAEVDRAASRLGFVRADDLSEIRAEMAALRAQLIVATASATDPAASPPTKKAAAKKAAVRKVSAATAPVEKSPAKRAAATKKATANKTPADKTPVKKTAAKKVPAAATEPDA